MPSRARPHALGLLQAFSAVGNIAGSLLGAVFLTQTLHLGWAMLPDGTVPRLADPVPGGHPARAAGGGGDALHPRTGELAGGPGSGTPRGGRQGRTVKLGSWREMFGDRRWRKNLIVGVLLVTAGAVGLWAIGFWTPELIRDVIADSAKPEQSPVCRHGPAQAHQDKVASYAMALQDVGAFFGMIVFTVVTARIGRLQTFGLSFLACFVVVFGVFGFMNQEWQIYLLVPLVGFTTLTVFGGYAIYLPELFPTRLRSTGTSLCYNAARYLTAIGVVHAWGPSRCSSPGWASPSHFVGPPAAWRSYSSPASPCCHLLPRPKANRCPSDVSPGARHRVFWI